MATSLQLAVSRLSAVCNPCSDAQLLYDFLQTADQAAFAELVRRHGPAVLGVCRRFLGPTPDAEDAFQETFLVLVRRARGTEWRESLGPWLYGVALRVARKTHAARAKRRANEVHVPALVDAPAWLRESNDEAAVVDEELAALPARYRHSLVLCEIQGRSRRDAARELKIAEGTLSSRLARGRKLLRDRLTRRGVVPIVSAATVVVSAPLATATVRSAVNALTHTVGTVPAGIVALTEGVMKTMIAKWKLTVVMVAVGIGLTGFGSWRGSVVPEAAAADPPQRVQPEQTKPVSREALADQRTAADLLKNDVAQVKVIAIVGANNVITNQEVWTAVWQQNLELSDLERNALKAETKELYTAALRKTIERELILDEMYTKLKKANKVAVIDEIKEFAVLTAEKQIREMRKKTGSKTDDDLNALLRAQGLTLPILRRHLERQIVSQQCVNSTLKEMSHRVGPAEIRDFYDKHVENLWRTGAVRLLKD